MLAALCSALIFTSCKKETDKIVKAIFDATAFTEKSCDSLGAVASMSATDTVTITFTNNSNGELHINWIDYSGNEQDWIDVADGTSQDVITYLTHPWIVRKADSTCVTILIAKTGASSTEAVSFEEQ